MNVPRETFLTGFGLFFAFLFGGWDSTLQALCAFMAIDFMLGVMAASLRKSKKTRNGGLSSTELYRGIIRKLCELSLVIMGQQMDAVLKSELIRSAVTYALIASEGLSILENMQKIGVPIPGVILEALEIVKRNGEKREG